MVIGFEEKFLLIAVLVFICSNLFLLKYAQQSPFKNKA